MRNLIKYIQDTNARHSLWQHHDTMIVGVSGGADSMCLMHSLNRIAQKENLEIIVAHVNHGLRKQSSDRDAEHVARWAQRLHLSYVQYDVSKSKRGISEEQWRTLRYDFFERMRIKHGARYIVTAHTKNDQAETVLLNLVRGSGLMGLSAMPYKKEFHIRPLLNVAREDIIMYCDAHHIRYFNDLTNADTKFTRNHIRKRLIPFLARSYNTQIITTLAKTAEILSDEYASRECCDSDFWLYNKDFTRATCAQEALKALSIARQRNVLRYACKKISRSKKMKTFGMIDQMRLAMISTKNKKHVVRGGDLKCIQKNATVELTREKISD